jgi:methylated-DNA-[protein]-cysteine S-methyltransferase
MQCRSVLTRIDALRTSELEALEATAVHDHLRTCRSCNVSTGDITDLAVMAKLLTVAPPRPVKEALADSLDRIDTAAGPVWVAFAGDRIRMIGKGDLHAAYARRYGRLLEPAPIPDALRQQVVDALAGAGVEKPRVELGEANDLERDVLHVLTRIPRGEVRTYAWVARQAGRPRAVRAVANVIARNILPFVVPCHRVVPSAGGIGNYAFGGAMKRELLAREGVDVEQLEALAREHVRYIGSATTHVFCFPTCRDARRIREENRVLFHDADDALEHGFRPCRHCQPVVAA